MTLNKHPSRKPATGDAHGFWTSVLSWKELAALTFACVGAITLATYLLFGGDSVAFFMTAVAPFLLPLAAYFSLKNFFKNDNPNVRRFWQVSLPLVWIPFGMSLLAYGPQWLTGTTGPFFVFFLPLSYYYLPVYAIIGGPYIQGGIGVFPSSFLGLTFAGAIWLVVSLLLALLWSPSKK